MSKIYLSTLFLTITIAAFSQQHPTVQQTLISSQHFADANMIPVQNGDVLTVRNNSIVLGKKSLLSKVLKAVGLATATYQSSQLVQSKGGGSEATNKANWLLPVGVGVIVSADKILPRKFPNKLFLKYLLYNKDAVLISEEMIKIDDKFVRKNEGNLISKIVPNDGFVKVFIVNKEGKMVASETNVIVDIQHPSTDINAEDKKESPELNNEKINTFVKADIVNTTINLGLKQQRIATPELINPTSQLVESLLKIGQSINQKNIQPFKIIKQKIITPEETTLKAIAVKSSNPSPGRSIGFPTNLRTNIPKLPLPGNRKSEPIERTPAILPVLRYGKIKGEEGDDDGEGDGDGDEGETPPPVKFPPLQRGEDDASYSYSYDPCVEDPCSCDSTLPGCPDDPCVIDPCSCDSTLPGCPDDPCVIDPCSCDSTLQGCSDDPCIADPTAEGCDPCIANPYLEGCDNCDETDPNSVCYIPCPEDSSDSSDSIPVDPSSFSNFLSSIIPDGASNISVQLSTTEDEYGNITFQLSGAYSTPDGGVTVFTPLSIGTIESYETAVNNVLGNTLYNPCGDPIQYNGGTVQNYTDGNGDFYAIWTDSTTNATTVLPGAYITTWMSASGGRDFTDYNGTIHADPATTLAGMEHEYGHYIQANIFGDLYYNTAISMASLWSAMTSGTSSDPLGDHHNFWTETGANALGNAYLGPNTALAAQKTYYKTSPCQ